MYKTYVGRPTTALDVSGVNKYCSFKMRYSTHLNLCLQVVLQDQMVCFSLHHAFSFQTTDQLIEWELILIILTH